MTRSSRPRLRISDASTPSSSRLALDTNRNSDLASGEPHIGELVVAADELWMPFVHFERLPQVQRI